MQGPVRGCQVNKHVSASIQHSTRSGSAMMWALQTAHPSCEHMLRSCTATLAARSPAETSWTWQSAVSHLCGSCQEDGPGVHACLELTVSQEGAHALPAVITCMVSSMAILPSRHDTKQPSGEAPHPPKVSVVLPTAASMQTLLASFPVARLQQLTGDHTALHTAIVPQAFERACHLQRKPVTRPILPTWVTA